MAPPAPGMIGGERNRPILAVGDRVGAHSLAREVVRGSVKCLLLGGTGPYYLEARSDAAPALNRSTGTLRAEACPVGDGTVRSIRDSHGRRGALPRVLRTAAPGPDTASGGDRRPRSCGLRPADRVRARTPRGARSPRATAQPFPRARADQASRLPSARGSTPRPRSRASCTHDRVQLWRLVWRARGR
jgi:hypothetical protein